MPFDDQFWRATATDGASSPKKARHTLQRLSSLTNRSRFGRPPRHCLQAFDPRAATVRERFSVVQSSPLREMSADRWRAKVATEPQAPKCGTDHGRCSSVAEDGHS